MCLQHAGDSDLDPGGRDNLPGWMVGKFLAHGGEIAWDRQLAGILGVPFVEPVAQASAKSGLGASSIGSSTGARKRNQRARSSRRVAKPSIK